MRTRLRSSSSGGPALATTVVVLLLSALLYAQFKTDVLLINVVATVVDGKGRTVPNLTIDDFIVEDDEQPQTITHFLPSADLPISIGIVFDVSQSVRSTILTAQRAVEHFLSITDRDDEIFLMTFDRRPTVIAGFTSDRKILKNALWAGVNVGNGTSLYDTLYQALQKVKQGRHQKKAVLLVTDGVDTTSLTRPEKALQNIREADMLVYSIAIQAAQSGRSGLHVSWVDTKVLKQFSQASGGNQWEIPEATFGRKMEEVVTTIASELRSQYSIAFYPNHRRVGAHGLKIRLKHPDYTVRSRTEYVDKCPMTGARFACRPLADVLHELESLGLKILFSSELVKSDMRVASEPTSTDPRKILDDVLEPHGLRARAGPNDTWLVVRAR